MWGLADDTCEAELSQVNPPLRPAASLSSTPLQLLLAKSLCSCREWLRASAVLHGCRSSMCVFFRSYAKYMAGEKAKCDAEAGRREALESVESSNM